MIGISTIKRIIAGTVLTALLLAAGWGCSTSQSRRISQIDPVKYDLVDIKQRDTLRVITRNHPLTYYLYKGTRRGFDFELIQKFAQEQGLVVEIVLPPTWKDMIPYLLEGKGDVIAAQMTITPGRQQFVAFTHPYQEVWQVAVGRDDTLPPMTVEELEGRSVVVKEGSSYDERLEDFLEQGIDFERVYHDEHATWEDPVQLVAQGRYPLTVVDNTIAQLEQNFYPNLVIGASLSEHQQVGWAVRPNAPELLEALDEFLKRHDRSAFFNILKKRYFKSPQRFRARRDAQIALYESGHVSLFDDQFRAAEEATGIDWRLLAAQSYHESNFYPDRVSWAGAAGLMQLMPETAEALGVTDIYDPAQNILGGARYMNQLLSIMDENLEPEARTWRNRMSFALAAYNAGVGHVFNARQLVREQGGDPDDWSQVAEAFVLLEQPEYYKQEEYSYVRGRSVRRYVYDILHRYDIFCGIIDRVPETEEEPVMALIS